MDLVIRALAQAIPEKCAAGTYQLFGVYLYRVDPRFGKPFLFIELAVKALVYVLKNKLQGAKPPENK